jgi:hypothetical protein
MKKQKSVKKLFKKNGLTNYDNYSPVAGYNSGTTNYVVIYIDLSNNNFYQIASNPTGVTQLLINATPSAITWTSGGSSTQQITVVDNLGHNVISNCVFITSNANLATVSDSGLITNGLIAGNVVITVTYKDPTYDLLVLTDTISIYIS